jgi:hypothetical protein
MSDVTPIRPDLPRDPPSRAETPECCDRPVAEIATLELVLATLSEWDLSGRPTDNSCHIGSAELVLRESIQRLNNLVGDVETIQSVVAKEEVPRAEY